jgi:hypothetical protein
MVKASAPESAQIEVAQNLYKYQNFKSTSIPKRVHSNYYKDSSVVALHSIMRRYLATGYRDEVRASALFYDTLDNLRNTHCSILRPSAEEEARPYSACPKKGKRSKASVKVITPAKKEFNPKSNKIEISESTMERIKSRNTYIALKLEDSFMTFTNMDEMNGFLKACTQFGKNAEDFEKVKITVESL